MKKQAFTSAEVLITLGIIGVVAALTMPTLIHNYRKSVVENKLKSEYSLIFNAIRMAEAKNGTSDIGKLAIHNMVILMNVQKVSLIVI